MTADMSAGPAVEALAALLEARTGQRILAGRYWRVETELAPVLRRHAIPSLDALVAVLKDEDQPRLISDVTDALLNNESFFFRDSSLFDGLKKRVLPELYSQRSTTRSLNIWCAGCSTGQEVYSLAMLFADDSVRWKDWSVRITGSDVSAAVIERAKAGRYSQFEIQRGLSVAHMLRYFEQYGDDWIVKDALRNRVRFVRDDVIAPQAMTGPYDLLLCRNVLMYFSQDNRARVFTHLADAARSGGYLVMGAAETIIGHSTDFRVSPDHRGFYRRIGRTAAPVAVSPQFISAIN